jgi:hypothetical protein
MARRLTMNRRESCSGQVPDFRAVTEPSSVGKPLWSRRGLPFVPEPRQAIDEHRGVYVDLNSDEHQCVGGKSREEKR